MVGIIAAKQNVAMPSFFGYMVWPLGNLMPVFILVTLAFFT